MRVEHPILCNAGVERSSVADTQARTARATGGKVMVCMSSYGPGAPELLRRGSRMAGRLSTDWFVVYVETPSESPALIDATVQRHLHDNIELARELGAEVVRLKGRDPIAALLDFARSHGVGHLVIGRSHQPRWKQLLALDAMSRFVRDTHDMDLHIVPLHEKERS